MNKKLGVLTKKTYVVSLLLSTCKAIFLFGLVVAFCLGTVQEERSRSTPVVNPKALSCLSPQALRPKCPS
jgi:hypothetical protein